MKLFDDVHIGHKQPIILIAGPCVIEDEYTIMHTAETLAYISFKLNVPFIFKSSFDKANRTSIDGFRGVGISEGLRILDKVKQTFDCRIITDVHEDTPLNQVADVVDVLQTPAFLCRQTNFITNVASCGLPVNIKKGQFLSPVEMQHVVNKAKSTGNEQIMICERGTTFGYNNLVVDMPGLEIMSQYAPVIFDATHSVQCPGGNGTSSGGNRDLVPAIARAATAVGVAGIFIETHPNPDKALSDGPNSLHLHQVEPLIRQLQLIDNAVKN